MSLQRDDWLSNNQQLQNVTNQSAKASWFVTFCNCWLFYNNHLAVVIYPYIKVFFYYFPEISYIKIFYFFI